MARLGQFRRDTYENWMAENPILADGEFFLVAMDSSKPREYTKYGCGDGTSTFNELKTYFFQEGGGSGTTNYKDLENKPSINGVVLNGNKTSEDLKLTTSVSQATETVLGGIKAASKTSNETVEAKIDSNTGKLFVPAGGMTTEQQNKLNGIEEGANKTVIEQSVTNSTTNVPSSNAVRVEINTAKSELNVDIENNTSNISSLQTKVNALSGIDSSFVGYFDAADKLPARTSPAWALVGNLATAKPYAYYAADNVPSGYNEGWNDLSGALGTYDFTDLSGYAKRVDLDSLGELCKRNGVKSINPTFKLGIPQSNGTIDESGAIHTTRAFVRIENFQSISTFDIELSEGWYCYIYGCDSSWKFTDPDDLIKNSNAPLTGVVNKGYDRIVVVVKYGSGGTQDLTNLLPYLNFEIKYNIGAYSPAAPYNKLVELSNKVNDMLGGMTLDLSSDFKLGIPQSNGNVTDSNIRAYYHWENFDKFSQFDIELSEGWYCYIYGCDSSWKFTDPDDLIKNSNAPLTGVVNKGYSHAVIGLRYGNGDADLTNLLPDLRFAVKVNGTIKAAIIEQLRNVNTYNSDKQPILSSLCRTQDPVTYSTGKHFVFAQITDTHGENVLVRRAIEYINDIDNAVIDLIIHTGDIQRKSFKDEEISIAGNTNKFQEYVSVMSESTKPALTCLGNHDQNKATNVYEQYERWMKYMVDNGVLSLGSEIVSGTSWYYKDFTPYKIRLIVLNSYDPLYDGFYSGPGSDMDYNNVQYSQAQMTFLADTLASVPNGYTVIVAQHAYFNLTISNPDWSSAKTVEAGTYKPTPSIMSADPVLDIIDAYQRKATINKSYSYTNQTVANKLGTVSVNKDFTSSNGIFGFCIAGHNHGDWMGSSLLYPSIKMVVMVGGILTQPDSDLGRDYNGKSQDAINIYVVNTTERKVHIVRIGADYTIDEKKRLVTTFSY